MSVKVTSDNAPNLRVEELEVQNLKRGVKDLRVFHRRKLFEKSPALNIVNGWKKVIALIAVLGGKIAGDCSGFCG
jgi:hypothetical protein